MSAGRLSAYISTRWCPLEVPTETENMSFGRTIMVNMFHIMEHLKVTVMAASCSAATIYKIYTAVYSEKQI